MKHENPQQRTRWLFNAPAVCLSVILLLGVFTAVSREACAAGETIATEHFRIVHEGVGSYYAGIASRAAERSYTVVTDALGHKPDSAIEIILAPDSKRFEELTRGVLPDWSLAAAISGNRIVISPLEGRKIELERIIAHEVVHCIINDAAGGAVVPRWFHEGCAEVLSGTWGIRGRMYMTWKVARGELLTFGEIQRIFSAGSADATLAYDQSMLAVRHLMRVQGEPILGAIIAALKETRDFPAAFQSITGVSPEEYEGIYLVYLRKAYGRRALYTYIPGTWTIILLLAFLVYGVKKIRTRRLMREWEEKEKADNIIEFDSFPPDEM